MEEEDLWEQIEQEQKLSEVGEQDYISEWINEGMNFTIHRIIRITMEDANQVRINNICKYLGSRAFASQKNIDIRSSRSSEDV